MERMTKKTTGAGCLVFLACILFTLAGFDAANAQPVITARLKAVPESFSGKCPTTVRFEGVITVRNITNPPLKVQYRFTRSDGALAPVETLNFTGDGTKNVSTTWTLGGPSLPSYSGWQAIRVLYPQEVDSNKADFRIECRAEAQRKPDLIVKSFGLKEWGVCKPDNVIFTFQVEVANIGTAPSPAIAGKAMVQALDQRGTGWGNGAVMGSIPAGESRTVTIPVYYLKSNPGYITGSAPHSFKAVADPLKLVDEQREDNNESSRVISVDPRGICGQAQAGITEDCLLFDPKRAEVKIINGDWKIVDGSHWMFSFGNKRAEADKALKIIKHYRMNQSCFVGRPDPSFQYLLRSGKAPGGAFQEEDCVSFSPSTAEVKFLSGDWKIVDGSHWMYSFGSNEAEARQALEIIKKYGFTWACFVGRPDPSFQYLRK